LDARERPRANARLAAEEDFQQENRVARLKRPRGENEDGIARNLISFHHYRDTRKETKREKAREKNSSFLFLTDVDEQ